MIARPINRIAEKGGEKSVREIDKEDSRLRGRILGGIGIALFFERNSSFALDILQKSGIIRANLG
jgi:hypothetical protein